MADPLEQIRALLALAADGDGTSEESRNAAVRAAQLMKKHGYIASPPVPETAPPVGAASPPRASAPSPPPSPQAPASPYHTGWLHLFARCHPYGQASPEGFLTRAEWLSADLKKVAIDRRVIADEKIKRLSDLCTYLMLPLPIDDKHPVFKRLVQLHRQHARRERERAAAAAAQQGANGPNVEHTRVAFPDAQPGPTPGKRAAQQSGTWRDMGPPVIVVNLGGRPTTQRLHPTGITQITLGKAVNAVLDFMFEPKRLGSE